MRAAGTEIRNTRESFRHDRLVAGERFEFRHSIRNGLAAAIARQQSLSNSDSNRNADGDTNSSADTKFNYNTYCCEIGRPDFRSDG